MRHQTTRTNQTYPLLKCRLSLRANNAMHICMERKLLSFLNYNTSLAIFCVKIDVKGIIIKFLKIFQRLLHN